MISDAYISEDGLYRYWLKRSWSDNDEVIFIMLNPSTADHTVNDPTIRRCIGFAQQWKAGSILVMNLFAYRSTSPENLMLVDDPVGPENEELIRAICAKKHVICAWGSAGCLQDQDKVVEGWLSEVKATKWMLAETAAGVPRHPLYLPKKLKPVRYNGRKV